MGDFSPPCRKANTRILVQKNHTHKADTKLTLHMALLMLPKYFLFDDRLNCCSLNQGYLPHALPARQSEGNLANLTKNKDKVIFFLRPAAKQQGCLPVSSSTYIRDMLQELLSLPAGKRVSPWGSPSATFTT